jgi:hypothetical protein
LRSAKPIRRGRMGYAIHNHVCVAGPFMAGRSYADSLSGFDTPKQLRVTGSADNKVVPVIRADARGQGTSEGEGAPVPGLRYASPGADMWCP